MVLRAIKTETVMVTHEGWFLFCPCWFAFDDHDDVMPVPKNGWAFVFECAMLVQQSVNWFTYLLMQDDELCGFGFRARELDEPFELEIEIRDED
jgi:hypothetical protein